MSLKGETQEILACRICLATDTELYQINGGQLNETFLALMGKEVWWCGVGRVCGACLAQLRRAAALRARCLRAEKLLVTALGHTHYITIDYIRTIDRMAEELCLNLKTYNVHSSDSTQEEVKLEDVKEEIDFIENIFISEPILDDDSYIDDNADIENSKIETSNQNTKIRTKRKTESTKRSKRKLPKSIKETKNLPKSTNATKKLPGTTKTTEKLPEPTVKKRIKRRMADNGFLPDFDFDEFESKYNLKIDILSKEEQLREIEARKMAPSYALAAFGCEMCGKGFASKQVYEAHTMKHDPAMGAHACGVCGARFRTRSRAHVHADAHRLKFTCVQCGFVTRTRFIAKNHFLSHAGTTYQCPHCDAVFTKYTSYLTHVRRRHPAMNVACDECGETFVGRNGLRHHKTRVHRNAVPKSQFSCESCGARFPSESALASHASENGDGCGAGADVRRCGQSERLCKECDMTFVDAASFATHHQRVHLNVRLKEPPRPRAPPAHALICEICGAECTSVSRLATHQRGHSGARPHACPAPACARRFSTRHNMRRHHRVVHLGQRPWAWCGACGKRLAHAAALKLHARTVHPPPPAPPPRPAPHPLTPDSDPTLAYRIG